MTTFIKTKFQISDDQTNIDKYRFIANITEYHIISKEISYLESPSNFQVKEKKIFKSVHKQGNWTDGRTDLNCRKTSFLKNK